MNYLAHLLLAGEGGLFMVGNLAGDFVRGRVEGLDVPDPMRDGIRLHRRIDSISDQHPLSRRARRRLNRSRVGAVLVDVAFDHFLARHWNRFSDDALERFSQRAYTTLEAHHAYLPTRLQRILPRMVRDDWLTAYRHPESLVIVIDGMARRLSRPALLAGGGDAVLHHYDALEADFLAFFPALERASREWRTTLATRRRPGSGEPA